MVSQLSASLPTTLGLLSANRCAEIERNLPYFVAYRLPSQ